MLSSVHRVLSKEIAFSSVTDGFYPVTANHRLWHTEVVEAPMSCLMENRLSQS